MPRRRFRVFIIILLSLMVLVWGNVWFSLVTPLELEGPGRAIALTLIGGTFFLQLYRFARFGRGDLHPLLGLATYFSFGLMILLFFAAVAKDVLLFVPRFQPHDAGISAAFLGGALLLDFLGMATALAGPRTKVTQIKTGHMKRSVRVVQISDLHVGALIKKPYVDRVIAKVAKLKPDVIVMTGDIGDSNPKEFANALDGFRDLRAPEGIYFVTGNHEYYWGAEGWIRALQERGVKVLMNEGKSICQNELFLAGVPDVSGEHMIASHHVDARAALNGSQPGQLKVLLAHQPKVCYAAAEAGFDVMLCGHTHGGQFFPINFLVGFFNPFSKGLNRFKDLFVYVNEGTGFWGPPLRLFVPAEISLLELS